MKATAVACVSADSAFVAVQPALKSTPQYRWYSIEAATSPRQDYMAELRDAYIRQGYKAALGTFYDEKQGQKTHRVLLGLYNSRAAAEQASSTMGKLLMPGARVIGIE